MSDSQTRPFDGKKLDSFKALFFSKEEHEKKLREQEVDDDPQWKKMLKKGATYGSRPQVKDPVYLSRMMELMQVHGIEDVDVTGYYIETNESTVVVDLFFRAKCPSWFYRLIFDETIILPLHLECREEAERTLLTITQRGQSLVKATGCLGCLIIIVLFGLLIVPGLVYLYIRNVVSSTWTAMTDSVIEATSEALRRQPQEG